MSSGLREWDKGRNFFFLSRFFSKIKNKQTKTSNPDFSESRVLPLGPSRVQLRETFEQRLHL